MGDPTGISFAFFGFLVLLLQVALVAWVISVIVRFIIATKRYADALTRLRERTTAQSASPSSASPDDAATSADAAKG